MRFPAEVVDNVSFNGGPGQNSAVMAGTSSVVRASMHPGTATILGPEVDLIIANSSRITIDGRDGEDVAKLYDSTEADLFEATPEHAKMRFSGSEDYFVQAVGLRWVHAYASDDGQIDTALLDGAGGGGQTGDYRA